MLVTPTSAICLRWPDRGLEERPTPRPRRRSPRSSRACPSPPSATSAGCRRSACRCTGARAGCQWAFRSSPAQWQEAGPSSASPRRSSRRVGGAPRRSAVWRMSPGTIGSARAPTRCSAAERRGAQPGQGLRPLPCGAAPSRRTAAAAADHHHDPHDDRERGEAQFGQERITIPAARSTSEPMIVGALLPIIENADTT